MLQTRLKYQRKVNVTAGSIKLTTAASYCIDFFVVYPHSPRINILFALFMCQSLRIKYASTFLHSCYYYFY